MNFAEICSVIAIVISAITIPLAFDTIRQAKKLKRELDQ